MATSFASPSPFSVPGQLEQQAGRLPPATPVYVLRGHSSPIHALRFYANNSRLISADADGWVVVWNMGTKRAVASWKAHESAVLGVEGVDFSSDRDRDEKGWSGSGSDRWVFTHGRDHKLRVWRLNLADEEVLSKELPVDESRSTHSRNDPWMFHSLSVNALNFCAFALCRVQFAMGDSEPSSEDTKQAPVFFLAVSNALNTGGIDIFHLPSEKRVSTISPDPSISTGMVMALELLTTPQGRLCLVSGYEDGRVMTHIQKSPKSLEKATVNQESPWTWERIYINRPHSQPVLSLALSPVGRKEDDRFFLSSSADAILAKHAITTSKSPLKVVNTKHAGQQGMRIRNDGKIFATAGWDCRVRVYSFKSMKELAVLKWHKEGCYAVAFADVVGGENDEDMAGQKATGEKDTIKSPGSETTPDTAAFDTDTKGGNMMLAQASTAKSLTAIKQQRSQKAQLTHWLAAGSNDGKISLWDIY
ncbi:hypothetical protein AJ79_07642 [Helicocarpus griseus UAMH5409]|uniref:ASTRA-associated protein 1 n=1 Tax=Helicocarpus griseus UAMH5409 TaxID=1447875 RepID=A0A2B7X0P6_9EURO|nr:hypothetical protein AJ79_07642 [Helicocarpus griseus UAMH5409]